MKFYDNLKDSQKITFDFLINTGARINECIHVTVDLINKHNQLSEIVLQAIEESKRDIELEKLLTLNNRLFGNNLTGQS
jgi:hypothetical protein